MSSKNNFLIYYITEDYHNLLYDHIYNHSKIDYEILDVISPELLGYNGVKSIDFCSECSSYKIKIANQYGYLIYADNQVQNVTFMDATVIAESGGMLGNFKLSEGTYFHSDANALLYGKMYFAGNVSISDDTLIRLDIDALETSTSTSINYLINDLSYIDDADFFFIDSKDIEPGIYCVAPNNAVIENGITIKDSRGNIIGTLRENQDINVRGVRYSIVNYYDYLAISVNDSSQSVEMTDEVYEWLAHTKAYEDLALNSIFSFGGFRFRVTGVLHDEKSGLDAYCVVRVNNAGQNLDEAVILSRGTENKVADVLADFDIDGIGVEQVKAGEAILKGWVEELKQSGIETIDFTGHSLGGALSQMFASNIGGRNVITFCSPGCNAVNLGNETISGRVKHYINSGDIIPMAGYTFLPGEVFLSYKKGLSISGTSIDSFVSFIDFMKVVHGDLHISQSENGIHTNTSEFGSRNFGYIAVKNQNNKYISNANYAKLALVMSLGNISIANLFTNRENVESSRDIISQITDIFTEMPWYIKENDTFLVAAGKLVVADVITNDGIVTGAVGAGLGTYFLAQHVSSFFNDCITISQIGNSDLAYVYTDNDNIPDLGFNCVTQEFFGLDFHSILDNLNENFSTANNTLSHVVTVTTGATAMSCFELPNFAVSQRYYLQSICGRDDVVIAPEDACVDDKIIFTSLQQVDSWNINYQVDDSVTEEKGIFILPSGVVRASQRIKFYLIDIDAAGEEISVTVKSSSGEFWAEVAMQETNMCGIFTGSVDLDVESLSSNAFHLLFGYDDQNNACGSAERVQGVMYLQDYSSTDYFKALEQFDNKLLWAKRNSSEQYIVEFSENGFDNAAKFSTGQNRVDVFSSLALNWRLTNNEVVSKRLEFKAKDSNDSQCWKSNADNDMDIFFANANGTWSKFYFAEHRGILNGWKGTKEQVALTGKNVIADVFKGSTDANVLVLTDDSNGDALFVDDIYTALPGTVAEQQARIAKIDEIRAGNGDDIVDMTSQRFAYIGDGVKIYGGLGNDTIWANNGNNALFGDAGNDRLVGGANNDVIVGGIGNDRMHGGGGDDIFTFGNNWGNDTIEQLDGGEITLWFESGEMSNWNADTLTYSDGTNSVEVSGVSNDNITLIFGDDSSSLYDELAAAGCFDDAASEKIFEDKNKGMLA